MQCYAITENYTSMHAASSVVKSGAVRQASTRNGTAYQPCAKADHAGQTGELFSLFRKGFTETLSASSRLTAKH